MIHSDFTLINQQYGNLHTNMKSYFQKILFICMVNLTFTTMTYSQEIRSEWSDDEVQTRGKTKVLPVWMPNQRRWAMLSQRFVYFPGRHATGW